MRLVNLLSLITEGDIIRIEDKEYKLLYHGPAENVPYKLVMRYIDYISTYDNQIDICLK